MTGEYIRYYGITEKCNVSKQLEVQQWIIDPSSRPYPVPDLGGGQQLIARSAASANDENSSKFTVDKQLVLQRMIIGD